MDKTPRRSHRESTDKISVDELQQLLAEDEVATLQQGVGDAMNMVVVLGKIRILGNHLLKKVLHRILVADDKEQAIDELIQEAEAKISSGTLDQGEQLVYQEFRDALDDGKQTLIDQCSALEQTFQAAGIDISQLQTAPPATVVVKKASRGTTALAVTGAVGATALSVLLLLVKLGVISMGQPSIPTTPAPSSSPASSSVSTPVTVDPPGELSKEKKELIFENTVPIEVKETSLPD